MSANDDIEELPVDSVAGATVPRGAARRQKTAVARLTNIAEDVERAFQRGNRVLSFGEYLSLYASHPARHGRSAPEYVRDMCVHYGTETVHKPWGDLTRLKLFDAPWATPAAEGHEPVLVGHERLQESIFRALSNFAREGRANRLVLMHGPNGSAKSTAAACILRALEDYSQREDGALYRFHWIFPSRKMSRGSIGFGGGAPAHELDSYAHLDDEDIDARLVIELRDHPLFLIPLEQRRELIDTLWKDAGARGRPAEWLYHGELSHKNMQIFEALLSDYGGSIDEVLRHVQVERYFISRRYRVGAVTLGPEMSVDAGVRQVTADRSLSALPTSLQATTLFEAHGELVDAAGGVLEFSDLLKRPIDAFRYLQLTLETGEVALSQQTVFVNVVMIASANEIHMAAFREHPEYPSFRGRVELMRVPYLRDYLDEEKINETQIVPQLRRHVAPHTTRVAAEFAVLTRMRRPDPERYDKPLGEVVDGLTAVEKMDLYALGVTPARLKNEERTLLKASVAAIFGETDSVIDYEGRTGVSPRTMRTLLLDSAQSSEYQCVSPFALLAELDELCKRTAEFDWLKLKPLSGGYHDHKHFREQVRERLLDRIEADMRSASGFIEEGQYADLFRRYITQVSAFVKGEKTRNLVTGKDVDADENLMGEVETLLDVQGEAKHHRDLTISTIAAWAIDHPGEAPEVDVIFPNHVKRLERAAFDKLRKPFSQLMHNIVSLLHHDSAGLEAGAARAAKETADRLQALGYNEHSAGDAASAMIRERYADLVD